MTFIWPHLPEALYEGQPWSKPGIEPTLCEVLADPIVQAVSRRDGVSRAALESVIAHAQQRLRQHRGPGLLPRATTIGASIECHGAHGIAADGGHRAVAPACLELAAR